MTKMNTLKSKELKMMATMLNDEVKEVSAIQKLKDGSRMTSTLYILKSQRLLNISNCITILFDTVEEMNDYISKKFEIYKSDKEMWQSFTGMDDETWEEWNK